MSSPLKMAREQCANYMPDGGCLEVAVKCLQSTEPPLAGTLPRCRLARSDGTCGYFANAVVRLVQYFPRYAKAVAAYNRRLAKQEAPPVATEGSWTCDCGKPMAKGRRMCNACTRRNRLAAKRRWKVKRSRAVVDT